MLNVSNMLNMNENPPKPVFQQRNQVNAHNGQSNNKSQKYENYPVGAPALRYTNYF